MHSESDMEVYIYNLSTQENGKLRDQGKPGLQSKFKTILHYVMRSCLKKKNKTKSHLILTNNDNNYLMRGCVVLIF
jgi:hypothetical protein